jgi:hypothetical protein
MRTPLYKKMYYHIQRENNEPVQTHSFFRNGSVLFEKLNTWNRMSSEYKYTHTVQDCLQNSNSVPEPLPVFQLGWYGEAEHHYEFNDGKKYGYDRKTFDYQPMRLK